MTATAFVKRFAGLWRITVPIIGFSLAASSVFLATLPASYTGQATLMAVSKVSPDAAALQQVTAVAEDRVATYAALAQTEAVLGGIAASRGTSTPQLKGQVSVNVPTDTSIIRIVASSGAPDDAANLANSVAESLAQAVAEAEQPLGGSPSPIELRLVDPATASAEAVFPRARVIVTLGLLAGLALSSVVTLLSLIRRGDAPRRGSEQAGAGRPVGRTADNT